MGSRQWSVTKLPNGKYKKSGKSWFHNNRAKIAEYRDFLNTEFDADKLIRLKQNFENVGTFAEPAPTLKPMQIRAVNRFMAGRPHGTDSESEALLDSAGHYPKILHKSRPEFVRFRRRLPYW